MRECIKLCIFELFACTLIQKKFTVYFWKKNDPCSLDGTANMAVPYCVHLDNFVNFTSVLGYFILNSHVRIGIYHSKTVQTQNFITGAFVL